MDDKDFFSIMARFSVPCELTGEIGVASKLNAPALKFAAPESSGGLVVKDVVELGFDDQAPVLKMVPMVTLG